MAAKDSIFGVQAPKFVDDEDNEVLLDYFVVLEDREDVGVVEHPSIINRHKEWVDRGEHWLFEGLIHLFKYDDPEAKYLELQNYYKQNVILYKRRDGFPYLNGDGDEAYFRLDKLEPINLKASGLPDVLFISFTSIETVIPQTVKLYDLGYLMNTVNDNPVGSHTRGLNSSGLIYNVNDINWDNLTVENDTSLGGYTGTLESVNGFKAGIFGDGGYYGSYASNNNSIFKDVVDATVFIAFKRSECVGGVGNRAYFLMNHNAADWSHDFLIWLDTTGGGLLSARMASDPHDAGLFEEARVISVQSYDDGQWHIVAVVLNRSAKRLTMYTDLGESITDVNENMLSGVLTSNLTQQTPVGYWRHKNPWLDGVVRNIGFFGRDSSALETACIGDIRIYYSVLNKSQIDKYAKEMADRLNINWIKA